MYKKVLEQLASLKDTMLLDAGCGSGMFSHMAIRAGADVIGVDAASGLLEVARQRNPKNNFLEEDIEALPFAPNSFDVVTAFNSFQYAGNFEGAVAEAKRVLKPRGRLVIGIWDKPEASEATTILKAISTLLPPPPPGTPGPFALSEEGKMESVFETAGLKLLYKTRIGCPLSYQNLSEGIMSFMGTGPAAAATAKASQEKVESVIATAFEPYRLTEERYHLQNQFLVFIASK
jgi:SAM-dependent methyltransferase